MRPFFWPVLAASLILQGSLISFPFVFVVLTIIAIKKKENFLFLLAFLSGLILDSFYFRTLGTTSLFFMLFIFAIYAYERKFEVNTSSFIFVSSFLGSMTLFLILGESGILLKALITSIFTLAISKVDFFQKW